MRAGGWPTDKQVRGETVHTEYWPGVALSPDGRTLAVVHPERDAVTLVDTRSMRITRIVAFAQRASVWQRLAALLPFWPQTAAAKALEGTFRGAVFAADGRHLYVYGSRFTLDGDQEVAHVLGLTVVDLTSGAMTKPILTDEAIERVIPAPDGSGVYVMSFTRTDQGGTAGLHLRRLDATTLRPRAARTFDTNRELCVLPKVPNTR